MKKYFLLILILILAILVRLYKIDSPIADWHSWRQADTASVTRNFIKEGFNPFLPRFDDSSGISERPYPNIGRYRFVEFPIYNMAVYPFYLIFGVNEMIHRLVSVLFSLGSLVFLFLIVKKNAGEIAAYLSTLIFALLPYNVFFSRTILPESALIFFSLGMMYFVGNLIEERKKGLVWAAGIFITISFLIKPWAIFYLLPMWYLYYKKNGSWILSKKTLGFLLLFILPFLIWRAWILQFPEGIPASNWLLNGDGIRLRPMFWYWLLQERIGREILGVTGAFLFFLGLILKTKANYFFHFWALSIFLYFVIFATGNVRHDYYQVVFVPVATVFVSLGFMNLIKGIKDFIPRIFTIPMALLFLVLMFYFSFVSVKELYKINNPVIIEAGKEANKILPSQAVVVAPYNGDTAFLYQINRPGWPVVALPLTEMVAKYGVTHLVSVVEDSDTKYAIDNFEVLEKNDKFTIVDLTKFKKL